MATIDRSADLAIVGANGGAWVTDKGAAIPTKPADYSTALPAGLFAVGAISDDGLQYAFDEDSEDFTAWGQLSPFRTTVTRSTRTFQLTMWETNRPIVKSVMFRQTAAAVTAASATGMYAFSETSAPVPDRRSWCIDVMDGENVERFWVPIAEVTDRDDVTFKSDEMSGYNVTLTAFPDSTGITVYHMGYIKAAKTP